MAKRSYIGAEYTAQQVIGWLSELKGSTIGIDIETNGLNPLDGEILLLQLSDGETTLVIDRCHLINTLGNMPFLRLLEDMLTSGAVLMVGHNLTFEHKWLLHHLDMRLERVYDTRWAHLAIHNGTPFAEQSNLGWVTWVALGRTRDEKKELQMSFVIPGEEVEAFVPSQEQIDYAAMDAEDVLEIMKVQMPKIQEKGLAKALKLRFDMVPVVGEMELHGAPVDKAGYTDTIERAKALLVEVEKGVIEMLTPPCLIWRDKVYEPLLATYMEWKGYYDDVKDLHVDKAAMDLLTIPNIAHTCVKVCEKKCVGITKGDRKRWVDEQNRLWKEQHPAPAKPKLETGPINLNSPQQVLGSMQELGYDLDATSKDALEDFIEEHPQQAEEGRLADYMLFKKLAKLVQAFGDPVLEKMHESDGTHIIQPSFNLMVSTGRMSCSEPNLQQVSKPLHLSVEKLQAMGLDLTTAEWAAGISDDIVFDLREHFAAPEGYEIGAADFSNIELRIAADLSGDEQAIQDFIDGLDFHGRTAAVALGITYDQGQELKAAHDFAFTQARNTGKIRNFATLYGAWDEEWRKVFSTAYPTMWEWLEANGQAAVTNGYARAEDGFRKAFPLGRQPHQHPKRWQQFQCIECKDWRKLRNRIIRQAKNFPIQSLSAAVTMAASTAVRRELVLPTPEHIRPRIWNLVHDELDMLILKPYGERVMKRVKEIAEREGAKFLKHVPVVVEIATGPSWSACK